MTTKSKHYGPPIIVTIAGDGGAEPLRIQCRRLDPVEFARRKPRGETPEQLIDRWVCDSAESPRIVMSASEASDEAIWIEDLAIDVRHAIAVQTNDHVALRRRDAALKAALALGDKPPYQ